MQANTIITDDMTLDQKLAAIDAAMEQALQKSAEEQQKKGIDVSVQADPADLTMCLGCQ